MRLDGIAGHELTHGAQQAEHASWQCHIPECSLGKGRAAYRGDCVRTGHMITMTIEARKIVGDKKIWSQLLDERSEVCGELVNMIRKLRIAETRMDNVSDAEGARRAPDLSTTAVCEFRLDNAGRVSPLSAGQQHKRHPHARGDEAVQRSAAGDGLIVRMRKYRHHVLETVDGPSRDTAVRGEEQGGSPESGSPSEKEAHARQNA